MLQVKRERADLLIVVEQDVVFVVVFISESLPDNRMTVSGDQSGNRPASDVATLGADEQ